MKILVDLHAFATAQKTGKHYYTETYLESLIGDGNEYVLACPGEYTVPFSLPKGWSREQFSSDLWFYWQFFARAVQGDIDAVLSPTSFVTSVLSPKPVTTIVYDLAALRTDFAKNTKATVLEKVLLQPVLWKSNRLLTISQQIRRELVERFPFVQSKLQVQPARARNFSVVNTDVLERLNIEPFSYFLYVGTIEPRKNILNKLRAFHRLLRVLKQKNVRSLPKFVLAGGTGWNSEAVFAYVEKYSLQDQVFFLGYVRDEDLPTLYRNARFFVYVPVYEGFGLPLVEALSFGKVCVTTDVAPMSEVVGTSGVLVAPHDIGRMSTALLTVWMRTESVEDSHCSSQHHR